MTAVTPELASFSLLPHLFVLSFCPFWSREQVCLKVSSQESFLYKAVNYSNKICDRSPQKFLLPFSDRRMDKLYSEAVALCIFVLFPQCFQNVFVHCACTEDFTSQCELQGQHVQDAISLSMITFCIACTCSSLGEAPDCLCWCWAPSNTGPQLQGLCLWHLCQHRLKSCQASHRGPVAACLIARSGWEKSTVTHFQIPLQQRHIAEPKRAEQWTADSQCDEETHLLVELSHQVCVFYCLSWHSLLY